MKKIYVLIQLMILTGTVKAQYLETFSTPDKGYLLNFINDFNGVNWTLSSWANQPPAEFGRDAEDYMQTTANGVLESIDLDQEVCWTSPLLVTTANGTADFTADLTWSGYDVNQTNPLEFINVEYQLNGGSWIRHPNVIGTNGDAAYTVRYISGTGPFDSSATTNFSNIAVTAGNTMQVRVCWSNNANAELTTLDNVSVTNFQLASSCLQPTVEIETTPTGSCNPTTGSIKVMASNGTAGYHVAWSGPESGDPAGIEIATSGGMYLISSLASGNYSITVTDDDGCSNTTNASVTTASALALSTQVLPTDCPGQSTGEIDLLVSNGVPPYVYNWNNLPNPSDPEDQTDLAVGTYWVTVTDQAGCFDSISGTVEVAPAGAYLETFSISNKGYLSNQQDDFVGVNWTLSSWNLQPPAEFGRDLNDFFRTSGGSLASVDLDQEVCWTSPLIDIQGVTGTASADLSWTGLDNDVQDYIDFKYSLDGGAFVQAPNQIGGGSHTIQYNSGLENNGSTNIAIEGLSGNSIQIQICGNFNADLETLTIDNVGVTQSLGYFCPTIISTEFSIDDPVVEEGNMGSTNLVFTVSRNDNSSECSVKYNITGGTATSSDNDYQALAEGTLNFTIGGSLTQAVNVIINGDLKVEYDETVEMSLSNPVNATILDSSGLGKIMNDDTSELTISNPVLTEGNAGTTNLLFNINLSNPVGFPISYEYSTDDETATLADNDYENTSGLHEFDPGETLKTVMVSVNGDCSIETDETLILKLSEIMGGPGIGIPAMSSMGTIMNDDALPVINCPGDLLETVACGMTSKTIALPLPATSNICHTANLEFRYRTVNSMNTPTGAFTVYSASVNSTLNLSLGRYQIEWNVSDGSGSSTCSHFLQVNDLELMTPVISGPTTICPNLTKIPYSVSPQPGITTYNWSYTGTGVTINNNGTADITLDFGPEVTSGQLSVIVVDPCGGSNTTNVLNIEVGNAVTCALVNCQVSDLFVSDNTFVLTGNSQIFKVSEDITSNATIQAPKTIIFKAGETINLSPGFTVKVGAVFFATIEDCPLIFPFESKE